MVYGERMKQNYYKTNGDLDVTTSPSGDVVCIDEGHARLILERHDLVFLIKCFAELLEE